MRTPISAVRWRTMVESTPYKPTAASTSAIAANAPTSASANRVEAYASRTYARIGFMSTIGIRGSIWAMVDRTVDSRRAGSPEVRTIHVPMPNPISPSVTYICSGPSVAGESRRTWSTTPMMSTHSGSLLR